MEDWAVQGGGGGYKWAVEERMEYVCCFKL